MSVNRAPASARGELSSWAKPLGFVKNVARSLYTKGLAKNIVRNAPMRRYGKMTEKKPAAGSDAL